MPSISTCRIVAVTKSESGCSLLEAIIATGLMAGALASLGQTLAISIATNRLSRSRTVATVLAQQKMEQLHGLTWGFDALGVPISDISTDTAAAVETPTGGTGLRASPAGTLTTNTDGWVDYVDSAGESLGGGTVARDGALYIRRWALEPLPASPTDTIVIHVLVTPRIDLRRAAPATRPPDEVRLVSIRTRKAP